MSTGAPNTELVFDRYSAGGPVRLHYLEAGFGETVLLLHGFPQFCGAWSAQIEFLKARWRVVAPDMRGFNLSGRPAALELYRMRHLVEDVRFLIEEELEVDRVTLVGHDWGGAVAWSFALQHPELLAGLVVVNAPPPFTWVRVVADPAQQAASSYMLDFEGDDAPERLAADDFAALKELLLSSGDGWLDEETLAEYREAWTRPGALRAMIGYYLAAGMPEQVRRGEAPAEFAAAIDQARIETPTMVIWGEREKYLVPAMREGLDRWVPNLRLEVLPGAGHWLAQERPDEINGLLADFLAR